MTIKAIAFAAVIALAGCATTTSQTPWTDATVQQVKIGMPKAELVQLFGTPSTTSTTSTGEALIFRRPADEGSTVKNAWVSVASLGMRSGNTAMVVDVLRVDLAGGIVQNFEFTENVENNVNFGLR